MPLSPLRLGEYVFQTRASFAKHKFGTSFAAEVGRISFQISFSHPLPNISSLVADFIFASFDRNREKNMRPIEREREQYGVACFARPLVRPSRKLAAFPLSRSPSSNPQECFLLTKLVPFELQKISQLAEVRLLTFLRAAKRRAQVET